MKYVSFINLYDGYGNNYEYSNEKLIKNMVDQYDKVLTLGTRVDHSLGDMDVDHFPLPHPSGLNRQINDPKFVHERLEACKNYLYGR